MNSTINIFIYYNKGYKYYIREVSDTIYEINDNIIFTDIKLVFKSLLNFILINYNNRNNQNYNLSICNEVYKHIDKIKEYIKIFNKYIIKIYIKDIDIMSNKIIILSMDQINNRIKKEICYKTIEELSDEKLMDEYINTKSMKNEINKLSTILDKNLVDPITKQNIIKEYIPNLVQPGTKGVIRGNKFNKIIKDYLLNLNYLKTNRFELRFEEKCKLHNTSEIPDWYILEKTNERNPKIIIGMNQIDLWSGGQQTNRGTKYIEHNINNNENSKLLCVVCNEIQFKSKNKAYKLFEIGFMNNTICYKNNLENIIISFFG